MQYSEIVNMPFATLNAYLEKIEVRKTETKLMLADVMSLPTMKKGDRVSLVNRWMKSLSVSSNLEETEPASPGRLKMMGIGVRHV
jgi:hypothetical protein